MVLDINYSLYEAQMVDDATQSGANKDTSKLDRTNGDISNSGVHDSPENQLNRNREGAVSQSNFDADLGGFDLDLDLGKDTSGATPAGWGRSDNGGSLREQLVLQAQVRHTVHATFILLTYYFHTYFVLVL